jgi:hypothetical protein
LVNVTKEVPLKINKSWFVSLKPKFVLDEIAGFCFNSNLLPDKIACIAFENKN